MNSLCCILTAKLGARLSSEESLAIQAETLVSAICPDAEDPAFCEAVLGIHWGVIALAMYPTFLEPNSVCGTLGACAKRDLIKEWTCEDCTGGIASIADVVVAAVPDIIEFLKVRCFLSSNDIRLPALVIALKKITEVKGGHSI
jgi:hypothetical protein